VYVTIQGTEKTSAEISNIEVLKIPQTQALKIEATVANTGTVHIRPFGTIIILDSETNEIIKTLSTGKSLPIFPHFQQRLPTVWHAPEPGYYTAVVTIEVTEDILLQEKIEFIVE
jgi:hypothetical protein